MRQFLIILALFCSSQVLFSQIVDGPYKEFYDSGELKIEGQNKNNKRVGDWKSYHKNGKVSSAYSYNNGKQNRERTVYYESGKIKFLIKRKNEDYIRSEYYETGELKRENKYKNGYYKEFYKDGTLKVEANYLDFQFSGEWKQYNANGILEWIVNYKEGYRNGNYSQYHKNGKLKTEGVHKNDKANGKELRYNEEGVLEWEGNYLNGNLNKTWTKYNSEGDKVEKVKYKNGTLISGNDNLSPIEIPDGIFEKVPLYPGCENVYGNRARKNCMSEKISKHVNTKFNTDLALKINAYGLHKIKISFKIDKSGRATDIKAETPILIFEAEAKRVINLLPIMKPGIQDGKLVEVPYTLPLLFRIVK
ncbi:hypothetical protein [Winogradskyella immobilis]|uniref:Antitoxin component YwqK of YwqJK toxin-antitoxin module n=1 Tax=Winogradskyella immobilis TaxID=2816852 RepID=A0ABS8EKN7_9FLAO|nr:hypothetical protein [Winogradskyella immobilis]MCC1483788.1 hypothetical protein [Winogradskyella immobilis]MCG0015882.1 hypothetical protein [Winogradskyella immobilis]